MGRPKKRDEKAYKEKLLEIYAGIPEGKKKKADELIERLADVLLMMDKCRDRIKAEGLVTEMQQGDYSIDRENPYSKIYDAKHKLMLATFDKLDKLQPEAESGRDELMSFLEDDGA